MLTGAVAWWVADIVNVGDGNLNESLDPSNPLKGSENLNDLLGSSTNDGTDGNSGARTAAGACGATTFPGTSIAGTDGTTEFAGTTVNTEERAEMVSRYFMTNGYNTNYSASWHMVRGSIRTQFEDTVPVGGPAGVHSATNDDNGNPVSFKGLNGTTGPLRVSLMDRSRISSSNVGMVGCAAPGDVDEAMLARSVGHGPALNRIRFSNGTTETVTYIEGGELLTEAFNDGPAFASGTGDTSRVELIRRGQSLQNQFLCEMGQPSTASCPQPLGPAGSGGAQGIYLQDTRVFGDN